MVYPARCPFCDEPVAGTRELICRDCLSKLEFVKQPYCMKCGKQLKGQEEYCSDCSVSNHQFDSGRSLLVYKGAVKKSVYRFKYKGRKEYARAYAALVESQMQTFFEQVKPDALVPVPLHRTRRRMRGYNQSELLARHIGRRMGVPVRTKLVVRSRNTVPQKNLDLSGRQNNLKKAFKLYRNDVKLNTIIIIDDIYTTGSTVDALAAVLRRAGVKKIYFLTLSGGK